MTKLKIYERNKYFSLQDLATEESGSNNEKEEKRKEAESTSHRKKLDDARGKGTKAKGGKSKKKETAAGNRGN